MNTTHYPFYAVESDPIRPFTMVARRYDGGSKAVNALTKNKRIHAMSASKERAEAIAKLMTERLVGAR